LLPLLELAHLVMVGLLLRHLLIPFLEICSSTTLHPRDVYFFFCFWGLVFWPAILYLHGMYRYWVLYMTLTVYGQYLWFVFMDLYLWLCVYGYVFMDCVYGYVYGHRVLIFRKTRFSKHRGFPLRGARFNNSWVLLLHEAHFSNSRVLLLHEAHFSNSWVLLLHEAHFSNSWVLLLQEAQLDDSSNFSNFPPEKWNNFAPLCNVK
jgi:hypothetical protein